MMNSPRAARPAEVMAALVGERRRAGVDRGSSRRSRIRGSTWLPATGSTTRPQLARRSVDPVRSAIGHIGALAAGADIERPSGSSRRARAARERVRARCSKTTRATGFEELLGLSRTVFPYVEEHKFFCDYWFLTSWWNKIREFGDLLVAGFLGERDGIFQLSRLEVYACARRAPADVAHRRAAARPDVLAADRRAARELLGRLGEWTPPPAVGAVPEVMHRPGADHALGRHDAARPTKWAAEPGRRRGAQRHGGLARRRRGPRPRRQDGRERSARSSDGEILDLRSITSPAWAPIFSKIQRRRHRHRGR